MKRFISFCLGQWGLWILLALLFVSHLVGPTIDSPLVRLLTSLFFSLFLISGVINLSPSPLIRALAALVVVTAIILRLMRHIMPSQAIIVWGLVASLMFLVLLTVTSVDKVFRDDRPVTVSRVMGAVAVYVLFGLTWSYLYGLLDQLLPGAFNLSESLEFEDPAHMEDFTYFSFITLTTLGYGDITPIHPIARMCVVVQALFGQLYPATLLARLVSLEISSRQTVQRQPSSGLKRS